MRLRLWLLWAGLLVSFGVTLEPRPSLATSNAFGSQIEAVRIYPVIALVRVETVSTKPISENVRKRVTAFSLEEGLKGTLEDQFVTETMEIITEGALKVGVDSDYWTRNDFEEGKRYVVVLDGPGASGRYQVEVNYPVLVDQQGVSLVAVPPGLPLEKAGDGKRLSAARGPVALEDFRHSLNKALREIPPPALDPWEGQSDAVLGQLLETKKSSCQVVWHGKDADALVLDWSGECDEGRAHSQGMLRVEENGILVYEAKGRMNQGEMTQGIVHFADGTKYEGGLRLARRPFDDFGVYVGSDGERYTGAFRYGLFHGHGLLTKADGSSYSGEFYGGLRHGIGTCNESGRYGPCEYREDSVKEWL